MSTDLCQTVILFAYYIDYINPLHAVEAAEDLLGNESTAHPYLAPTHLGSEMNTFGLSWISSGPWLKEYEFIDFLGACFMIQPRVTPSPVTLSHFHLPPADIRTVSCTVRTAWRNCQGPIHQRGLTRLTLSKHGSRSWTPTTRNSARGLEN